MFEIYEKPVEEGIAKFENMDNFNTSDDEFEILWQAIETFVIIWTFSINPSIIKRKFSSDDQLIWIIQVCILDKKIVHGSLKY